MQQLELQARPAEEGWRPEQGQQREDQQTGVGGTRVSGLLRVDGTRVGSIRVIGLLRVDGTRVGDLRVNSLRVGSRKRGTICNKLIFCKNFLLVFRIQIQGRSGSVSGFAES